MSERDVEDMRARKMASSSKFQHHRFKVWCPTLNICRIEALTASGYSAKEAAESFAEAFDSSGDERSFSDNQATEVYVTIDNSETVIFKIVVQLIKTYHAKEKS